MNPYRCETCNFRSKDTPYLCKANKNRHIDGFAHVQITETGCASHSDFQSEREKLLDEFILITKHEYRLLEWVFDKLDEGRYSDALSEIITGVEQREELRQAGER